MSWQGYIVDILFPVGAIVLPSTTTKLFSSMVICFSVLEFTEKKNLEQIPKSK